MRIPGTNWDIEVLRQLESLSSTPFNAPLLTRVVDNPLAVDTARADLVKEEKAIRTPSDPEVVDAYMIHMYRKCFLQRGDGSLSKGFVWCLHR